MTESCCCLLLLLLWWFDFFKKFEILEQITNCQILWTFLWYSKMGLHQVATSLLNWCVYFYQQKHQINQLCLLSICGKVYDFPSVSFCAKLPLSTTLVLMIRFHQSVILFLYLNYILKKCIFCLFYIFTSNIYLTGILSEMF